MMEDVSLCEAWVQSWRNEEMPWQKRWTIIEAGKTLAVRLCKHKCGLVLLGKAKKVVKNCKRFQIIPTGPMVVLNETQLHETPASDSPMDSPMSQDSPIKKEPRPIGRKAAKAKRGSNSSKNASKFLEELPKHQAMRIEMDLKQQENDMAIQLECAKEREYVRKEREYGRVHGIWFIHFISIVIIFIFHNHVVEDDTSHHCTPQHLLVK
ncbi:hypothetical protein Prudu_405S000400, partial [Prunus dulcis]